MLNTAQLTVQEVADTRPWSVPLSIPANLTPKVHNRSLDGLRALAVFGVIATHAGFPGSSQGFLGVDLFFALSGFLITTLLLDEFGRKDGIDLRKFWGRRFLRLMPVYWLVAACVTIAIVTGIGHPRNHGDWTPGLYVVSLWMYFANYAPLGGIWDYQHLIFQLWSLSVEEQFYLFWPIVLAIALRRGVAEHVAWAFVAAVFLYRVLGPPLQVHTLYTRGFGIFVGAAIAVSFSLHPKLRAFFASPGAVYASVGVSLCGFVVATGLYESDLLTIKNVHQYFVPFLDFSFAALIGGLWYSGSTPVATALSWRPAAYLGTISYGIYVYHEVFHWLTWDVLLPDLHTRIPRFLAYGVRFSCYAGLTVLAAIVSYELYESRFLKLKERLR